MKLTDKHYSMIDDMIYPQAKAIVESGQEHAPVVFLIDFRRDVNTPVLENLKIALLADGLNDNNKNLFAAYMNDLVTRYDAIAFVSETWMSSYDYKDKRELDRHRDSLPRPRDDPNRREAVVVNVRSKESQALYVHYIERNPTKLLHGELWASHLEGRFTNAG